MDISSFDDLLRAAQQQPEPQRLLFVFASADLPDHSTPEQRARFQAGQRYAHPVDVRGQSPRRVEHGSRASSGTTGPSYLWPVCRGTVAARRAVTKPARHSSA